MISLSEIVASISSVDSVCRSGQIAEVSNSSVFDIVVVGGGIHGATVARIAAGLGFRTALLEKSDYASATSSRSSKMAHGGLRYLELFDFEQVFEGIKAREEMFEYAGYLVKPSEFLIPVAKRQYLLRLKLGIGLFLYDLMVTRRERRHRWIPRSHLIYPGFHSGRHDLMGCYVYTDGIMSDARMVIDNVIGARRYGAVCLNYCGVEGITRGQDGVHTLFARDVVRDTPFPLRTRVVINCCGPWASDISKRLGGSEHPVSFSRGSHIIFSKKWDGPSLFLPMPGKARYYFVWPHPAGTLVGTTERPVTELELDPTPSGDEIEEILDRLERDIPDAGLTRANACYAFAGLRCLPLRDAPGDTSILSRKHIWSCAGGVLTLLGGKYTTAAWTALEGVTQAARMLGKPISREVIRQRVDLKKLPGSADMQTFNALEEKLRNQGVSEVVSLQLLRRYGSRIERYLPLINGMSDRVAQVEAAIALDTEQVECVEDLMRRRLELEYCAGHGEEYIRSIREVFQVMRPEIDFDRQIRRYWERMKKIDDILHESPDIPPTLVRQ